MLLPALKRFGLDILDSRGYAYSVMGDENGKEILDFRDIPGDLEVEGWNDLTEIQKKIVYYHALNPDSGKYEIAKAVGCSAVSVYNAFSNKTVLKTNTSIAKVRVKELLQLACKAMKECLISEIDAVKFNAAKTVLMDAALLTLGEGKEKEDSFTIKWKETGQKTGGAETGNTSSTDDARNTDKLFPPLQTKGSSRIPVSV